MKRRQLRLAIVSAIVLLSFRLVYLIWTQRPLDGSSQAIEVSLEPQVQEPSAEELERRKYFHEPGDTDQLHHYDVRFFKGIVSDKERADTLHHMIRAYLIAFRDKGLETWIAHGSLLGWWWNGQILPWDWDLDVQVSGSTISYLGRHLNHTYHRYVSPTDRSIRRDFLLDVNPLSWERVRGDGMNVIDARWIDIRNGLFIDITGISETNETEAGVWSCKNLHRYQEDDLWPLRESVFEGVWATVPYAYGRVLEEEYSAEALVRRAYQNHTWEPLQKAWISVEHKKKAKGRPLPLPPTKRRRPNVLRPVE